MIQKDSKFILKLVIYNILLILIIILVGVNFGLISSIPTAIRELLELPIY